MSGYQNAVVTGPVDSEIHCDEYGRVKVQFAWDRVGEHNEHSNCWLRVASGLAHEHYGSVLIPRVGMKVLVGFVNGDMDMPLVMGCLPNAAKQVPAPLSRVQVASLKRSAPFCEECQRCASRQCAVPPSPSSLKGNFP